MIGADHKETRCIEPLLIEASIRLYRYNQRLSSCLWWFLGKYPDILGARVIIMAVNAKLIVARESSRMKVESDEPGDASHEKEIDYRRVNRPLGYYQRATKGIGVAIAMACKTKNWSLTRLGNELGIAQNTILRWKSGRASRIELAHVIQMFDWADVSMDDAFGLGGSTASSPLACSSDLSPNEEFTMLQDDVYRKDAEIDRIRSQYERIIEQLLKRIDDLEGLT